jgi:5-methylcytosine-specific restriction endonuclease McrA
MTRPTIDQEMRRAVAERYGCRDGQRVVIGCHYCGDAIVIDRTARNRTKFLDELGRSRPELDHVEPLYWGGSHHADNLVPACLRCNRSKGPRRLLGTVE